MESFNADRQKNLKFNDILQKIKYKTDTEAVDGFIYFPLFKISDRGIEHQEDPLTQIFFNKLKEKGAIEFSGRTCDEINKTLEEAKTSKNKPFIVEGYWVKSIEPKFSQLCEEYAKSVDEKIEEKSTPINSEIKGLVEELKTIIKTKNDNENEFPHKKYLKSIHLVSTSITLHDMVIWLVLDEHFEMPIRFATESKGKPTAIKNLYYIAYCADVSDRKIDYDKNVADNVNNGLFKKREIARYMKTNNLEKPTLIKKSEDGKTLVLKGEVKIKTFVKSQVPSQHRYIYKAQ